MARIDKTFPHQLKLREARERAKNILRALKEKAEDFLDNSSEEWDGNTCSFVFVMFGEETSGTVTVTETGVRFVTDELPESIAPHWGIFEDELEKSAAAELN